MPGGAATPPSFPGLKPHCAAAVCQGAHKSPPATSGETSINPCGEESRTREPVRRWAWSAGQLEHPTPTREEGQVTGTTLRRLPKTSDSSVHQAQGPQTRRRSRHGPSHVPRVLTGCRRAPLKLTYWLKHRLSVVGRNLSLGREDVYLGN